MWPFSARSAALAIIAIAVLGAYYWLGYRVGRADGDRDVRKMLEAGQAVVHRREVQIGTLREQADEDAARIAKLSRGARVRTCPPVAPGRLPGSPEPDPAGADRAGGEDITELLTQCLRTFGEVTRARTAK